MKENNKTKAIAFCRIASVQQLPNEDYLQKQTENIQKFATENNVQVTRWWHILASGKKNSRSYQALTEMLDFCKKHRDCKYLIVDSYDRIARTIAEYYWWKVEFERVGITFLSTGRPLEDNADKTTFDELINIYRIENFSEQRNQYIKTKMAAKVKAGYYPHAPHFGYKTSRTPGLHVPDLAIWEDLQKIVRSMSTGKLPIKEGSKLISELHNSKCVTTRKVGGRSYTYHTMKILTDPYYAGFVKCDDELYRGLHKPLVTHKEWEALGMLVEYYKKYHRQYCPVCSELAPNNSFTPEVDFRK